MSLKVKSNGINFNVPTIENLPTERLEEDLVCVVTDENRGGVFVYREANALVNNGGTIFNGWTRQYDGAVNVDWFGAYTDGTHPTETLLAIQNTINYAYPLYKSVDGHKTYLINGTITIPSYRTEPAVDLDFTTINVTLNKVVYEGTTGVAIHSSSPTTGVYIKYLLGAGGNNNTVGMYVYGQGGAAHRVDYISGFGKNIEFSEAYSHKLNVGYCHDAMVGILINGNSIHIDATRIGGRFSAGTSLTDATTCDIGIQIESGTSNYIRGTIEYCKRTVNSICFKDSGSANIFEGYIESGAEYNIYADGSNGRYIASMHTNQQSKIYIADSNKLEITNKPQADLEVITGDNSSLEFKRLCKIKSKDTGSILINNSYTEKNISDISVKNELLQSNNFNAVSWGKSSIGTALWSETTVTANVPNVFPTDGYNFGTRIVFPAKTGDKDIYKLSQASVVTTNKKLVYGMLVLVESGDIDIQIRLIFLDTNKQSKQVYGLQASTKWRALSHEFLNDITVSNAIYEIQFRTYTGATILIANAFVVNGYNPKKAPVNLETTKKIVQVGFPIEGNTIENGLNMYGPHRIGIHEKMISQASLNLDIFYRQQVVVVTGGWTGNLFLTSAGLGDGHIIILKRDNIAATGVMQILPSGVTIDGSVSAVDIAPVNKVVRLVYSSIKNTWLTL